MQTEIEAKFLDIKPSELKIQLKELGAIHEHPKRLMKRKTFDDQNGKLRKIGGWIRVRDEGDKITLSYKQLNDRTLHGTKEITIVVNDFDATALFLEAVGFRQKSFQETKREKWILDGVEITIDDWPWIPTFAELEGESEEQLKDIAIKLGLDWNKALYGSVETAYQAYYNVTEEEIDSWKNITFVPMPDWLEMRKKWKLIKHRRCTKQAGGGVSIFFC